jgi:succinate dehydrogenase / fumarate reductase flavoprotein subunit/L-aspartate oxidase
VNKNLIDVLIIGSGGAGCAAAIEAKKLVPNVAMITKGTFLQSKTANAQGGIQAAVLNEDSIQSHIDDTLRAGEYMNDIELVKLLAGNALEAIHWLEELGVEFDKLDGEYHVKGAGGLSHPRILSCGDKSGNRLMGPIKVAINNSGIDVIELTTLKSVKTSSFGFIVEIQNLNTAEIIVLETKSIILATGGFLHEDIQSGLASAHKVTAKNTLDIAKMLDLKLINQDLVQYHPTGILSPKELRRKRVPETVRSSGANLLNNQLKAFCDPLLTRNILTEKIIAECKNGNGIETGDGRVGVWLNTPLVDQLNGEGYLSNQFPSMHKSFKDLGVDIAKEMILVYPILHYSLGGIVIDKNTSTNMEGIFAAGEATYGVHGKDRLMGNSLLEIFVFGRISGKNAAKYCINQGDGRK